MEIIIGLPEKGIEAMPTRHITNGTHFWLQLSSNSTVKVMAERTTTMDS
jgi:hypothetical protein